MQKFNQLFKLILLVTASMLLLNGCVVISVADAVVGTTVEVGSAVVGTAVHVGAAAVSTTADVAQAGVHAMTSSSEVAK
ncbi:hypothetical protein AAKU67_001310 [Oxalobacteraceae bacterium GrIS 2.11]